MTNEIKGAHLKLRIPKEKKEQIRQIAYSKGLSMSSYIRYVLSENMDDYSVHEEKTNVNIGGNNDER